MLDLFCEIAKDPFTELIDAHKVGNDEIRGYLGLYSLENDMNDGVAGYDIIVNFSETKYTSDYIDRLIEQFRIDFIEFVEKMSDDEFAAKKANTYYTDIYASNRAYMNFIQIKLQRNDFRCFDAKAEYIGGIDKREFMEFVRAHCFQDQWKLSIHIVRDPLDSCSYDGKLRMKSTRIRFVDSTAEQFVSDLQNFKLRCPSLMQKSEDEKSN